MTNTSSAGAPRAAIAAFAAARGGFGAALLAAPERVGGGWLGAVAEQPAAQVAIRGIGARDVALSAGALAALAREAGLRPWLLAAVGTDLADVVAAVAARDGLPPRARAGTAILAGAAAVAGAILAARSG